MDGNKFVQYLTGISVRKHEFVKRHINICNYGMEKTAIGFLLKGSGEFTARDRKILLNEKEVIYIPKGQVYTSVWSGDPKVSFYSVICEFSTEFPENENEKRIYGLQKVTPSVLYGEAAFQRLLSSYESENKSFFKTAEIFYGIYCDLMSKMSFETKSKTECPLRQAIRFINENCCLDFDIASLAKISCMSESRFYERFKEYTGVTPIEYKNMKRIYLACELLENKKNTVETISERLNFSSPAYFRRVFKSITGKTPKEYRKSCGII